ncbi:MAG: ATP-binding cassette domain-containing protein [Methylotenera sp.]|nr:ATP-binding cassette domain-containing protein [Oligoflexia bacterium]
MDIRLEKIQVRLPEAAKFLFEIRSLEILFGSRVLIQGPSGRGKTTLLHLLAGLFLPDSGTVRIGEHTLSSLSDRQRSDLRKNHFGIIFQRLNLFEHLTAHENVLLGLHSAPDASLKATRALEQVGMSHLSSQQSGSMSLGEQQRVAVARVLATLPDIVLADEPTSSLDDANTDLILNSLFQATEGKTLIVVSHDHRIEKFFTKRLNFDEWVTS